MEEQGRIGKEKKLVTSTSMAQLASFTKPNVVW